MVQRVLWSEKHSVGTDYDETYAHVAKWNTLTLYYGYCAHHGWPILHIMDVRIGNLNNRLQHCVHMLQQKFCEVFFNAKFSCNEWC